MTPRYCGDFLLRDYLTAGGMADLYLAESPRFPSLPLVVKTIQPRYLEHTKVVQMFVDEGRIAQALDHPNIVKIVDVGQADGQYFIAMEYIHGKDLVTVLRRGVEVRNFLPRAVAVRILLMALRGLMHAHEKRDSDGKSLRIVHCDISPGNIVVSWGGTAKIVDFGIARATIQLRAEDESVAGKYNYMAPEQVRGEDVDARADLFSLGVILYETTVGRRLFRGRPEQVIRLVLDEDIRPPSESVPDFPPELERIIMRSLERDLTQRYQSARELYADLSRWLAQEAQPEANPKRAIAEYLHAIFNEHAKKLEDSDEFGSESMVAHPDDLGLNRGVPRTSSGLHELPVQVDAPDAPDGLFAPVFDQPQPDAEAEITPLELHPPSLVADEPHAALPLSEDPGASDAALQKKSPEPGSAPKKLPTHWAPPRDAPPAVDSFAALASQFADDAPKPFPDDATVPLPPKASPFPNDVTVPLGASPAFHRDEETGPSLLPPPKASDVETRPTPKLTPAELADTPAPNSKLTGPMVVSGLLVAVATVGAALYFLLRG